jgi:hypothetical protein
MQMFIAQALADQKIHDVIVGARPLASSDARYGNRRGGRPSAIRDLVGKSLIAAGTWVRGTATELPQSHTGIAFNH